MMPGRGLHPKEEGKNQGSEKSREALRITILRCWKKNSAPSEEEEGAGGKTHEEAATGQSALYTTWRRAMARAVL